jgi:hypothetical protein
VVREENGKNNIQKRLVKAAEQTLELYNYYSLVLIENKIGKFE